MLFTFTSKRFIEILLSFLKLYCGRIPILPDLAE